MEYNKKNNNNKWNDINSNPHIFQVKENPEANYTLNIDEKLIRILPSDFPKLKYRRRKEEVKTVIHWGQRKLLLSEIEFLTLYGDLSPTKTVLYVGAAPGTHIKYLSTLFPNLNFILIDPAPFSIEEKELPQIKIERKLFTDEDAKKYSEKKVLFICDVRSADWSQMTEEETEACVLNDMKCQEIWHNIMKPAKSMLKFRLSWKPGKTLYLKGDIYFPIWGPITTTESRLIPSEGQCEYDNTTYEQQMFFFNTVTRVTLFDHKVNGEGIDHCYDCSAEVHVLNQFFLKVEKIEENSAEIYKKISDMSKKISRSCARDRTLASPNLDPGHRKAVIIRRQYINGIPAYSHKPIQKKET